MIENTFFLYCDTNTAHGIQKVRFRTNFQMNMASFECVFLSQISSCRVLTLNSIHFHVMQKTVGMYGRIRIWH